MHSQLGAVDYQNYILSTLFLKRLSDSFNQSAFCGCGAVCVCHSIEHDRMETDMLKCVKNSTVGTILTAHGWIK